LSKHEVVIRAAKHTMYQIVDGPLGKILLWYIMLKVFGKMNTEIHLSTILLMLS